MLTQEIIDSMFDPNIENYTFTGKLCKKTLAEYKAAINEFINYYKRIKGIKAIYQFGSITSLGFSDLDLIVVLADDYRHRYGTRYDIEYFSKDTRYILLHGQSFICETLMKDIYFFHDLSNLKKIYGQDIQINKQDILIIR